MKLYFSSTVPAKDKGAKKTNLDSVRGKKKRERGGLSNAQWPPKQKKTKASKQVDATRDRETKVAATWGQLFSLPGRGMHGESCFANL